MKNRLIVLFAVLALVASSLACSFGSDPTLDNVRTALDEDGEQPSTVFGSLDTIYVVSDLSNGVIGNVVTSKWYAVNVEGIEANFLFDEADINIEEDNFNGTVYFYYPPPDDGGWPVGSYRVEVYFNDALISTVEFTVE